MNLLLTAILSILINACLSQCVYIDPTKLNWEHFKGKPAEDKRFAAWAFSKFTYKYKLDRNGFFTLTQVAVQFCQDSSWRKIELLTKMSSAQKDSLFIHELYHYKITILIAKKLKKELLSRAYIYEVDALAICKSFVDQNRLEHMKYDEDTNHGNNREQEKIWVDNIDRELTELRKIKLLGEK